MARGAKRPAVEAGPVEGPWELPRGWRWERLGDLGHWYGGGTPSKAIPDFWTGGTIPWVSAKDMKSDYIDDTEDRITDDAVANSAAKRIPAGSVLCVMRSGILRHSFPVAVTRREVTINQDLRALHPRPDVHPGFLAHYLRRTAHDVLHECSKDGTTVNSIEAGRLIQRPVPLPPFEVQRAVVSRIEELFVELDEGEAALGEAQRQRNDFRRSLLHAAVTGSLSGHYHSDVKQGTNSGLPLDWRWSTVGAVGRVQLGRQRTPKDHSGPNMRPYLRVANVFEERISLEDVKEMNFTSGEFATFKLIPGDILLNEGQSLELVGRPAIYRGELADCCFQNTLIRFQAGPDLSGEYALLVFLGMMHSGQFQRIAKITTNIAHLGASRFAQLPFPLPPIAEQLEIVRLYREQVATLEGLELQFATSGLRQSILAAAFRGDLAA